MKIVRKDIPNLNKATQLLLEGEGTKSKRLVYSLVKNLKKLELEVDALQKAGESENEGYVAFTSAVREQYQKYGKKNGKGELVKEDGTPGFTLEDITKADELEEILKGLQETHKPAIDLREQENKDYQTFVDEEIELELELISFESLPEDIDSKVMFNLDLIITPPID